MRLRFSMCRDESVRFFGSSVTTRARRLAPAAISRSLAKLSPSSAALSTRSRSVNQRANCGSRLYASAKSVKLFTLRSRTSSTITSPIARSMLRGTADAVTAPASTSARPSAQRK